jgi:hypothetical protein
LEYVRLAKTGKTHIGKHDNWPELEWHDENGLPWVAMEALLSDEAQEMTHKVSRGAYGMIWIVTDGDKVVEEQRHFRERGVAELFRM